MLNQKVLEELLEYVNRHIESSELTLEEANYSYQPILHSELDELTHYIKTNKKPTFSEVLFHFIDKKKKADPDVYKKAGMDRRLFSKIRSNPEYRVSKNNVIALALALELTKKEMSKLLTAAGYSLSESDSFDLVILFCLDKEIYNIQEVNQALDYCGLKPLGGVTE
ncbi:hypothetical protein LCL95_04085 [Bacillus timonensis]|nr:hypothetical protein [Bacillus timonensis]